MAMKSHIDIYLHGHGLAIHCGWREPPLLYTFNRRLIASIAKRLQNSNVMRKAILVDNHIEKHMPVNLLLECFPG